MDVMAFVFITLALCLQIDVFICISTPDFAVIIACELIWFMLFISFVGDRASPACLALFIAFAFDSMTLDTDSPAAWSSSPSRDNWPSHFHRLRLHGTP